VEVRDHEQAGPYPDARAELEGDIELGLEQRANVVQAHVDAFHAARSSGFS
jgi:hypothetical protein